VQYGAIQGRQHVQHAGSGTGALRAPCLRFSGHPPVRNLGLHQGGVDRSGNPVTFSRPSTRLKLRPIAVPEGLDAVTDVNCVSP
jgi:hypothetical protein